MAYYLEFDITHKTETRTSREHFLFLSTSLARARASTDHFFLSPYFDEIYLCILNFPLFEFPLSCVLLAFAHTYVFLSLDFEDIDNSPIAKRTHVLSAFARTYVLLSSDFDAIDNTSAF